MKLTKNLSKIVLFFFIVIVSCNYKSKEAFLIGTWKYVKIQKGDSLIDVNDNDYLYVFKDQTFKYNIESLNKDENGIWSINQQNLELTYSNPDTTRPFKILILSKNNLKLEENNLVLEFLKEN